MNLYGPLSNKFNLIRTQHVAHGLKLASFQDQKGLIATINEEGWLEVVYLGTEPPSLKVKPTETRDYPYEELKKKSKEMIGNLLKNKKKIKLMRKEMYNNLNLLKRR